MESSRFFVANLPENTTANDLKLLFQDFGKIKNIELKTKQNLVDPDDIKILAFVTLNIGTEDAQYYLNDLNRLKVKGQRIKVSLAKESFIERLKREREEANAQESETLPRTEQHREQQSDFLRLPRENQRKVFDVDGELDDDEVAPELMISKKRAASSIYNGKIIIQSQDVQPIHVIETKHKKNKQMANISCSADQKRKESLNKMKSQYQQNKSAIQQALKGLDAKSSKKIKFSDAESDQEEQTMEESARKSKKDIFGSDDDSDDDKIGFKSVPSGTKGEKLVQMQAKQSLDPRFRIDAKFVDDDEENDKEVIDKSNDCNAGIDDDNERQWQMNILEQVVGTKLDTVKSSDKLQKNKKMLRYDPSKDEHQKFERSIEEDARIKSKSGKTKVNAVNKNDKSNSDAAPPEVSKEVFYVVTDTLQQSLRSRGEGFSLLNMFGKNEQLDERDEQLKQLGNEKILVNNKLEKSLTVNPFNYDSSSESESEEMEIKENTNAIENDKTNTQTPKMSNKKAKIAIESFFISKNDIRLKEGAKFFVYKKNEGDNTENYEEVRNRLKLLIKTKITRTKKNLVNAGYKGKRKF